MLVEMLEQRVVIDSSELSLVGSKVMVLLIYQLFDGGEVTKDVAELLALNLSGQKRQPECILQRGILM